MKSLFEFRAARAVAVAVAIAGLSASLGTGVAAAKDKPSVAIERKAAAGTKADERRPIAGGEGRKVG